MLLWLKIQTLINSLMFWMNILKLGHLLILFSKMLIIQMRLILMSWVIFQMDFLNLMKPLSNLSILGSKHFSNLDHLVNGQKIVDLKQQWILALMMQCKCLSRSILKLPAVNCMVFVVNSTFLISYLTQTVKWQQLGLDSNTPLCHQIMISFEIW